MAFSTRAVERNNQRGLVVSLLAALVLATVFQLLRLKEFFGMDFRWDSHPYGSVVWALYTLHFTHMLSAILGTALVALWAYRGYYSPERRMGTTVDALYWQFVVLVWIPQYLVIYWTPKVT